MIKTEMCWCRETWLSANSGCFGTQEHLELEGSILEMGSLLQVKLIIVLSNNILLLKGFMTTQKDVDSNETSYNNNRVY